MWLFDPYMDSKDPDQPVHLHDTSEHTFSPIYLLDTLLFKNCAKNHNQYRSPIDSIHFILSLANWLALEDSGDIFCFSTKKYLYFCFFFSI